MTGCFYKTSLNAKPSCSQGGMTFQSSSNNGLLDLVQVGEPSPHQTPRLGAVTGRGLQSPSQSSCSLERKGKNSRNFARCSRNFLSNTQKSVLLHVSRRDQCRSLRLHHRLSKQTQQVHVPLRVCQEEGQVR